MAFASFLLVQVEQELPFTHDCFSLLLTCLSTASRIVQEASAGGGSMSNPSKILRQQSWSKACGW